jgi:hypothetical protein
LFSRVNTGYFCVGLSENQLSEGQIASAGHYIYKDSGIKNKKNYIIFIVLYFCLGTLLSLIIGVCALLNESNQCERWAWAYIPERGDGSL